MKYNVVISRTYATELVVEADNKEGVHEWLETHQNKVYVEELEQCNIIEEDVNIELISPSPNEVSELQDLVQHINLKLQQYSHVEDFIPQELYKALEQMLSHDED